MLKTASLVLAGKLYSKDQATGVLKTWLTRLLASLLLTSSVLALPWKPIQPDSKRLPLSRRAVVYYAPSLDLSFHAYATDPGCNLDLYREGRRLARHRLGRAWTKLSQLRLEALLEGQPQAGFALCLAGENRLQLLTFTSPTAAVREWTYEVGPFSTTGWGDLSLDRNASGALRVVERHDSPGEETEQGRSTDTTLIYYDWDSHQSGFVQQDG